MRSWPTLLIYLLVPLVVIASLFGIASTRTYALETDNWAAQAVGQDWTNLLLLAPTLLASAIAVRRGSQPARLILAGALLYSAYSAALYAFAVHFNTLFLVYCAVLGISLFSLGGLVRSFVHMNAKEWFGSRGSVKVLGFTSLLTGLLFAALWLGEDISALATGTIPTSVSVGGFFTNPVHVLDLSVVLPAMVVAGIALLRRRPLGYVLAPTMATFAILMGFNLCGLSLVMHLKGVESSLELAIAMAGLALIWSVALVTFFRSRRARTHHPTESGTRVAERREDDPRAHH